MPKLVQINVCNNCYSSGKIVSSIGELAIKNGWDSYIAYSRDFVPNASTPIRIGNKLDVGINAFEQRLFDNTGFGIGSYFSTKKLVRELKIIQPDIIHLHVIVGYYLNFRVLFNYLSTLDIPIVWTIHSCWEITGHCTHFDYEGCEKWKTGCYNCPLKKEYPQSYFFDNSRRNYINKNFYFNNLKDLHLVVVSKWLKNVVIQSFLKDKPIDIIYNGVDTKLFSPSNDILYLRKKYNLEDKFVAVALASSWQPKKGILDYFKLADLLSDDCVLIMVGLPETKLRQLPSKIIGVRKTTNLGELRDFYSLADVVLNLSYEESFGLTTVEGLACGTPSIVYDKTASPELVTEETGFIVKAGDITGVLKSMELIRQKGKGSYSKACRERAMTVFDKDKNFKMYIELYNKLLRIE